MLKFPYGISDFRKIIEGGYFYVDRTAHIRTVERLGEVLLFLRPRRFGKSLWLSTLENYYDVGRADDFERLFGGLAIGREPTPLHNRYLMMRWNFSAVDPSGDVDDIRRSLFGHINACVDETARRYGELLGGEVTVHWDDALVSLRVLLSAVQRSPYRLYLLIDEYDNFANEVMVASQERYEALVRGEGVLKTVFKVVKDGTSGLGIDRVFITGVSPVVMSDMTSGFNVGENVYLLPELNAMCGFKGEEVAEVVQRVAEACELSAVEAEEALTMLERFYNGYCFSPEAAGEWVYNPTLVLYFLKYWQRYCKYPRQMLDTNLAMDRNRLAYAGSLPQGGEVILQALNEGAVEVEELWDRFGLQDMLEVGEDAARIASLLYYLGVLTLGGVTRTGSLRLRIPNLVIRRLYAEQMREMLLPRHRLHGVGREAARELYVKGEMGPLCAFIEEQVFPVFSNRDYRWANELTVKTVFLAMVFNDVLYVMDSEPELGGGYADLVMIIRPDMRKYAVLDVLIEFKYVRLREVGLREGEVKAKGEVELKAMPVVGGKFEEAREQLRRYRAKLERKYGDVLRLRTYAVVALGFSRLLWEEVT